VDKALDEQRRSRRRPSVRASGPSSSSPWSMTRSAR
jgi:hypothetical protein